MTDPSKTSGTSPPRKPRKLKGLITEEQLAELRAKARKQHDEFEATIAALPMSDAIRDAPTVGVDEKGDEQIKWPDPFPLFGEQIMATMTRRMAVRLDYMAAKRAEYEASKPPPLPSCSYCNLEFDDEYDADTMCTSATEANGCRNHPRHRPKFTPRVVGPDYVPIENDPDRLAGYQSMINDGSAWHPDIDQDGCIGRQADDLITRKLCKPPRSYEAKRQRHYFDVARRFGINRKGSV